MASTLIDYVTDKIDPKEYFERIITEPIHYPPAPSEPRVPCVFHKEKDPSLHFNPETGAWYCHGCGAGGKSIVSFHAKLRNTSRRDAAAELYHQHIRPTIPAKLVRQWHRVLLETPTALGYLKTQRLISPAVINKYKLGWNGNRITIPVQNEFSLYVNRKAYDPLAKAHHTGKMVNYRRKSEQRSYGSPTMLFPLDQLYEAERSPSQTVVVCEGEWDALVLISLGIPAVTTTNGSKSWPSQYNNWFRGLKVIIAYDNDKDGTRFDAKVVQNLKKVALEISRLNVPKKVGKDVTDWALSSPEMRKRSGWLRVLRKKTKLILENPKEVIERAIAKDVTLNQASHAENYGQRLNVKAIITGKDTAPYLLPHKYRVSCARTCESCPLAELGKDFIERKLDPHDPGNMALIDATELQLRSRLIKSCGIDPQKPGCAAKVDVVTTYNVEQLLLIPTLDTSGGQYAIRSAFYAGHGLLPNRAYNFQGVTVPDPQDQHATHLFDAALPVQDEVETFTMNSDTRDELSVFKPGKLKLMSHLMAIAEWQSRHVTKIRERPDVHVAVDLVYHSVASFEFNREFVRRGMLDVLIIGDTRCGKGYVAEGLSRFYGLGEVVSGDNCSFPGLVGGLQEIGKRWRVTWGAIPLNNGRLVIVDEAGTLKEHDFGRLTRVRSEGIAEVNKVVREQTQANARLLWLSNTRSGRHMSTYDHGILAIKELVGANEDVARFDFAVAVAKGEVASELINAPASENGSLKDVGRFPREVFRKLILWAWSRRPEQVTFTEAATSEIIAQAIRLGYDYSSEIPLVQAENIRIKLAKVAAAIAARTFSTDATGEMLIVNEQHALTAGQFLRMTYTKESLGYDAYSKVNGRAGEMADDTAVATAFKQLGGDTSHVKRGLMQLHKITADGLTDYVGDAVMTRGFISDLVKLGCLGRIDGGNWYLKSPTFSSWLRANSSANGVSHATKK